MLKTEKNVRESEIHQPLARWLGCQVRLVWGYVGSFPQGLRLGTNPTAPLRVWQVRRGLARAAFRHCELVIPCGAVAVLPSTGCAVVLEPGCELLSLAFEEHLHLGSNLLDALPALVLQPRPQLQRTLRGFASWVEAHGGNEPRGRPTAYEALDAAGYVQLMALVWSLLQQLQEAAATTGVALRPGLGTQSPDPRLDRLLALLQTHATTPFPDKGALAAMLGVSWRRIEQLCRSHWDESPQRIHDRLRAREAGRRLHQAGVPVKQVAFALGFTSAMRFSQWFKRQTGHSPRDFRTYSHVP